MSNNQLDRVKSGLDDDSAKFLGMLAFVRPETEWSDFMRLVDTDGNLKRNLRRWTSPLWQARP